VKYFIFILLSFLYIFGPVVNSIGSWVDFIFITSVLITAYARVIYGTKIPSYFKYFALFIPVSIYSLITIMNYPDAAFADYFRFLLKPIRILITIYAGYSLVFFIRKYYGSKYQIVVYTFVFIACILHGGIMTYQLFNPEFKDWVYALITTGDYRSSYGYNFRMGGLSGSTGGAVLSVVQALGILVIPSVFKHTSVVGKLILVIGGLFLFFTILICGRSGIYVVILFIPFLIFLSAKIVNVSFMLKILAVLVFLISAFIGLLKLYDSVESKSPLYYALTRSLDTFLDARKSGSFDDKTVVTLQDHIVFPNDVKTWVLGNPEHLVKTQYDRTLNSDIGYIRNIWSFGIFFSFSYWVPIIIFAIISFLLIRKYDSAKLVFVLSLLMLFFHAKENYLYVRMFLSVYSMVLFTLYFEVREKISEYK